MNITNEITRKRKHDKTGLELQEKRKKEAEDSVNLDEALLNKFTMDTCPICLSLIEKKLVGTPKNCGHRFCLRCIRKWSKRKNTCPLCRTKYKAIVVQDRHLNKSIKQIPVKKLVKEKSETEARQSALLEMLSRVFSSVVGNLFVVVHG